MGPSKQHNRHTKKPRLRDRAMFSRFYDIRPGNRAGLFLQPQSMEWYGIVEFNVTLDTV